MLRVLGGLSAAAVLALFLAVAVFGLSGTGSGQGDALIPTVRLEDVLEALRRGDRVVFVDVREPQEYAELHLPGAVNLPVRSIDHTARLRFAGARYVIAYCPKDLQDFRGFEGAKWLHFMGVENVRLMEGFGINAWQAAQLPLAGETTGLSDGAALEDLRWRLSAP